MLEYVITIISNEKIPLFHILLRMYMNMTQNKSVPHRFGDKPMQSKIDWTRTGNT